MTNPLSNLTYQLPPKAIVDLIDTPPTPAVKLSPSGEWLLLLDRKSLAGIEELAQEELKLAGLRLNPLNNGPSRVGFYYGITLKHISSGVERKVEGLPENVKIGFIGWSPNGEKIVFTNTLDTGIELWCCDIASANAKRITDAVLNCAMPGNPFNWWADSKTILVKTIVLDRGVAPQKINVPLGPIIQENDGVTAAVRTYQDLLKNTHDESLFEYYTTAQLNLLNVETGLMKPFIEPGIIGSFNVSPDGSYVMVVQLRKPFSYLVPQSRFPFTVTIYDKRGTLIKEIANIPLSENIPIGFGAVREGRRSFAWRADAPATIYWVEAQDGGNPAVETDVRDRLYALTAPFSGIPAPVFDYKLRFGGITWGNGKVAITLEWQWKNRQIVTYRWSPNKPQKGKKVLFDHNWEDVYHDPGTFITRPNEYGRFALAIGADNKTLFLNGVGASPAGNQPFIDEFNYKTLEKKRLWESAAPYYELAVTILDIQKGTLLTRRESVAEPPNYFLRNYKINTLKQLTFAPHPYESLKNVQKKRIQYQRSDGTELRGTLYLPADYDSEKDGRLPVLMWAYPREFKSKDTAGQVKDSPYEFLRISWASPILWVTQGYAIFNDFSMPIIGEGEEEPNETFLEQLRAGAEAGVQKIIEMGIADPQRIAVGGHSYGAFMTANLLAHTDLFAVGIARSGAYNRTLTPFGFQLEERTFWEAPEVYNTMSPFHHADKIKAPLLLIHGEADSNSGTFPMQSERFYAALKGHGAKVRLVMLPYESHGYQARESIMHTLWEMTEWLKLMEEKI